MLPALNKDNRHLRLSRYWLACSLIISCSTLIGAEPFRPQSADHIVANLSPAVISLAERVRAREGSAAGSGKENPQQLLRELIAVYNLATTRNDERAYGHALQLIDSWPAAVATPPLVPLIEAGIRQHQHEFDTATAILDRLLRSIADNHRALEMRAQIGLVTGAYAQVAADCAALDRLGHRFRAMNCRAQLDGVTGQASAALAIVANGLQLEDLPLASAIDLHITGANVAYRLADHQLAEQHFNAALALAPDHRYLLIQFSDWLLEHGRPDEAVRLLSSRTLLPGDLELQMIYTEALRLDDQENAANARLETIDSAISDLLQRAEDRPHKLIARHALVFSRNYGQARAAALANWQQSKEPGDLWLLTRAAVANTHQPTLEQVQQWRAQTGLQDYRLDALLDVAGDSH